ncbi:hypothetical protein N7509_000701 [Penicillium cosmopolitanum]|uniref:F-box domain-containing protein n=1 Tax=Penicillium cosmopolitanum TaxID=1131564 RepID=A0A9W9WBF9_9EURO|nr:uncharacterized protein N7509_000701 [Penicillium cosmopolitanum]KAJ5414074.1 hypothetical protein N7509_000701 [Penicillium cosmopolitanum]
MAGACSNWADRPASDRALSSDEEGEEDFVSTHSTASLNPDDRFERNHLSTTLNKVHLHQTASNHSSEESATTRTSTPLTAASMPATESDQKWRAKSMKLLDLPLDVLKDIVKEITHTNDLTSLALTCSALHGLTIPHMYSRFDIVWPESLNPSSDDYSGVDALSYGLSTLVMGEDVFNQLPSRHDRLTHTCSSCGCSDRVHQQQETNNGPPLASRKLLRAVHADLFDRQWSTELAVARMVNLETFIWDMPTGVVREIWLALASLADRLGDECRLEKVWVRWHDNSENVLRIAPASEAATHLFKRYKHVEHPSLSVLPALKSVAVLDIDEPAYVEELAVLIERSRHRLAELRIGVSLKAHLSDWLVCAKDSDAADAVLSWPRHGGLLSILSKDSSRLHEEKLVLSSASDLQVASELPSKATEKYKDEMSQHDESTPRETEKGTTVANKEFNDPQPTASHATPTKPHPLMSALHASGDQLHLELLELERIPLSISTLLPTIDWTRLTTLTLMRCDDHEHLWRALRRKYAPPATPPKRLANGNWGRGSVSAVDYSLNIKHLRTDNVSSFLMLFIKDALAPNTLESVFLHESPGHESNVQIDAIYRHILRKHRLSLRKVLIDASERHDGTDNLSHKWHKWVFSHEIISFITSGKIPQLRELGMAMNYRDWHYFLQRLPNMPQLRALYLPHISHCAKVDLKELALQVLDIVSIRPELKMTYIGLQMKCYQIQEGAGDGKELDFDNQTVNDISIAGDDNLSEIDAMSIQEDDQDIPPYTDGASDLLSSDLDDDDDDDDEADDDSAGRVQFRLQEILFYDDKISIFKARHGVL